MIIQTPTINRIVKMTEFDLLRTQKNPGDMYMCIDTRKLYYDETVNSRVVYNYTGVKTVNDLMHNLTPEYGITYYCWEDNSLWIWLNKWRTLWTDQTYPSGFVYDSYPTEDSPANLNGIFTEVIDNNGLLQDGSVVVRDRNRIIKGKVSIDDGNDNLVISSYLGGGLRLLPNGYMDTDGELFIGDEGKSKFRTELHLLNSEQYVDYSEHPELEDPEVIINPNTEHVYQILHTGNVDPTALKPITPIEVYNKLTDPSLDVWKPFPIDVEYLGGIRYDGYSLVTHTHTHDKITDFYDASTSVAREQVDLMFSNADGRGIDISYVPATNKLTLGIKRFTLNLKKAAVGTVVIDGTKNTYEMEVDVIDGQHRHAAYEEDIRDLQTQLANIGQFDPRNYATITYVDNKIAQYEGTATPQPGRTLLVNNQGVLPGVVTEAQKFEDLKTVTFTNHITGTLTTDFGSPAVVSLSADNIISNVPVYKKALLVDENLNLPANATSSSKWNHDLTLKLAGGAVGTAVFNGSENTVTMNVTLNADAGGSIGGFLTTSDIGVLIPELSGGYIRESQIPPGANNSLYYGGTFIPTSGYPTNPKNNQYYIAAYSGRLNGSATGEYFVIGDWIVRINGTWKSVHNGVTTVNGQSGEVNITTGKLTLITQSPAKILNDISKITFDTDNVKITNGSQTGEATISVEGQDGIFFWNGQSSDDDPDNLTLWQEIWDYAENNIALIVCGNDATGASSSGGNKAHTVLSLGKTNKNFSASVLKYRLEGGIIALNTGYSTGVGYSIGGNKIGVELTFTNSAHTTISKVGQLVDLANAVSTSSHFLPTDSTVTLNYTPTRDDHPATKKYVDDAIATAGCTTVATSVTVTIPDNL